MSGLATQFDHPTPERVALRHDVAGIGTRFTAGLIDFMLLFPLLCGAGCVAVAVSNLAADHLKPEDFMTLGLVTAGIQSMVIFGYYLVLETLWSGKTVGKHWMRIRVVSATGGAAPVSALFLRNIVRVADQFPFAHILGGFVMFANGRAQRLGDLAAGTIVVRERKPVAQAAVTASADGLSAEEAALVRTFLARNPELDPLVRTDLARRVVARISERHSLPPADPEYLITLLGAGHAPSALRAIAGPRVAAPRPAAPAVPTAPLPPQPQRPRTGDTR